MICDQEMAVEMVLTLGQAFEVAYQLAMLKTSASETSNITNITDHTTDGLRTHPPPVNSVKPIMSPVVTNTSNVTVGLH